MKEECQPIFIIGSARTGTSALVGALKALGIPGYNEGHYLTMLASLLKVATDHVLFRREKDPSPTVMMSNINVDVVAADIILMMKKRMEAEFPGKKVWFDKTPHILMIKVIPYIMEMWPKARFIFAKRRAVENLQSRLRKLPHIKFKMHCEDWADCMIAWRNLKHRIPENQRIEIDQHDMGLDPKGTAEKIGTLLSLGLEEIKQIVDALSGERIEYTGGNEKEVKALDELSWTTDQIELYKNICADVNRESGYSDGANYYL